MRQVPQGKHLYTLIGSGRVAKHFAHFFSEKNINFQQWSRNNQPEFNTLSVKTNSCSKERLIKTLEKSSHVFLALTDDSLINFIKTIKTISSHQKIIHFSGALSIEGTLGLHPLMTFGPELYQRNEYDHIPFVLDQNIDLKNIVPELDNPFYHLPKGKKELYHCFCSMAGNFTQILWQKQMENFEYQLELPANILFPFMMKCIENIQLSPKEALTGPLKRGDTHTINKHLKALEHPEEINLYKSFISYFNLVQNNKPSTNTHQESHI